jgi:ATP-dependent exoDNAse (exonuclease V) beta subunit
MVDEFQDTNRLQTDIVDLICGGPPQDLFFVGDEFQSIYGFRHADVAVFRDRRESSPQVLPLTLNYRSRPEVLAAVNELFADAFGDGFEPLEPAAGYAGKLEILRLREEMQKKQGPAFILKEFHDRLLVLGAPPIHFARELLLAEEKLASSPAVVATAP